MAMDTTSAYLSHFELQAFPFTLTPDVQYFCKLDSHQSAMNVLLFSINSGEGFIKVTGEVGVGKTLLCRKLLGSLGDDYVTAYIPNPDINPAGLRRAVAREFGLDIPQHLDPAEVLERLSQHLLKLRQQNKRAVLIVDEAQAVSDASLEAIRLLTNLETPSEKLLQIVLFAQPELDQRLKQYNMRQLKQRITFACRVQPLSRKEMQAYLCHRLAVAGHTSGSLFNKTACRLLYRYSGGLPRVINMLCHKALLVAFGRGETVVSQTSMRRAITDSQNILAKQAAPWLNVLWYGGLAALCGVLSCAATVQLVHYAVMRQWVVS